MIKGLKVIPLERFEIDDGGFVGRVIRSSDSEFSGFGEAYISAIPSGAVRAWKRHNEMRSNLTVVSGLVRFVLFDNRVGSDCAGEFFEITLGPGVKYARLAIPSGIWMGFQGIHHDNSLILNIANQVHDPGEIDTLDKSAIDFKWDFP